MLIDNRIAVKVAGASGQGINSIGEVLAKSLKNSGYRIFAYREYPSLIKGGHASYQIEISDRAINSAQAKCEMLVSLGRVAVHKYLFDLKENGILIHSLRSFIFTVEEKKFIEENNIKVIYVKAFEMALEMGHNIFANIILTGLIWKCLGQELELLKDQIKLEFADKPKYLPKDLEAVEKGYNLEIECEPLKLKFTKDPTWSKSVIIDGNSTLSLGAIKAGVRAYYAYPMTPASSILSTMAKSYKETRILVKQAEDEITAAQMTLGSMFTGTRALVGTSGGGFDLMTETLSLAGITEIPFVCVIAQRPGPATGLPTWTSTGDLNLALYGGHGEFPRAVMAASDVHSAYELIQHAFNIAEEYQIPVLVLTEKQIAESLYNIEKLESNIEIKRNLVPDNMLEILKPDDRYKYTETGVSKRWLPGESDATYVSNSDEHLEDGSLTEEAETAVAMMDKRMRKLDLLTKNLPDPIVYGEAEAEISFVGWGSPKSTIVDTIVLLKEKGDNSVNYLHFDYIFPLKTEVLTSFLEKAKRVILLENNMTGQFGELIRQKTSFEFKERLLKYNGRPFFVDDILEFLSK